ncbi:MAG: NADPH-dependent 7-cyano-7-deazaguanine reductase QueF, partial [Steroidobacteraceae bacterium]
MSNTQNPLGQAVACPVDYAPELLFPVARTDARASLAAGDALPFDGEDVWNAWELSWLDGHGRPVVATAEFRVPASSPNLIESKSLKLYLGSLAMTRFASREAVRTRIAADLGKVAGEEVGVAIATELAAGSTGVGRLPGLC